MNVIILYGGRSGEHEVSQVSAAAIARNINKIHQVSLVGITKDGRWYKQDSSILEELRNNPDAKLSIFENEENLVQVTPGMGEKAFSCGGKTIACDIVFPINHGTYGEDGTLQGLFEMADIPYVGCGVLSSAVTMDKEITKILLEKAGIPVVPYVCISRAQVNDSRVYDAVIKEAITDLRFPLFVKPCCAGSSDGASKAKNEKELSLALMEAFQWDDKVLIEQAINAREVECSVTGNSITEDGTTFETKITAYGPGEIVPKHTFYDYDAKYNDPDGAELKIPALLEEERLEEIRTLAKKAYKACNNSGLSRVDFFIDRDTDKIYLNEINTLPGFTGISMFPKMCEAFGLEYTKLIDLLLAEGIARHEAKSQLRTSR